MLAQETAVCVGARVECNGQYATVQYVGGLPSTTGLWLGVQWDDITRGKHDGSFRGVHYFQTRCATSGSFVRTSKVNLGVAFATALKRRYGEIEGDEMGGVDMKIMARYQKMIKAPFLQVVGFDKVNKKQGQFHMIKVVCLRDCKVNGAGPLGELETLCPQIRELDLSRTLLRSWADLSQITIQLKHLERLTVSANQLSLPEDPSTLQVHFQSLKHIVMGLMNYTWPQILHLVYMFPDIQSLLVQFNNITFLDPPPSDVLSKLSCLDLEGNNICDWKQVNQLGGLPCLETLNLTNTGIGDIWFPATTDKTHLFSKLHTLNLIRNKISTWRPVCELDKLAALRRLRIYDNPVFASESMETCRQLVIASVGLLAMLNGVPVTEQERKGAEYDYLKKHGHEWLAISTDDTSSLGDFQEQYPRYQLLVDKYGAPEEGEIRVQSNIIADNLITVEIFSPDNLGPPKVKKLLPTMIVQKLSGYAQRLFDTGNKIPQLAYISSKNPGIEIPIENGLKQLDFYSIEDGDRISVRW